MYFCACTSFFNFIFMSKGFTGKKSWKMIFSWKISCMRLTVIIVVFKSWIFAQKYSPWQFIAQRLFLFHKSLFHPLCDISGQVLVYPQSIHFYWVAFWMKYPVAAKYNNISPRDWISMSHYRKTTLGWKIKIQKTAIWTKKKKNRKSFLFCHWYIIKASSSRRYRKKIP